MREALAKTGHDYVVSEPPRARSRQRRPAPRRNMPGWSWIAFLMQRPVRTIGGATLAALVTGIVLNALVLQTARHPAPLFASPRAEADKGPTPMPPARPTDLSPAQPAQQAATAQPASEIPTASAPVQHVAANPPADAKPKDPIAAMLNQPVATQAQHAALQPRSILPPVDTRPTDSITAMLTAGNPAQSSGRPAAAPQTATILAAQRALQKLGFVVRPDGKLSAATRQAIEMFERDRKLPVTGDLSVKVLAELQKQSGIALR